MEDEKTDVQPSENAEEKETPKTDDTQTAEDTNLESGESGDGGKQEEQSPYDEQIKELQDKEKKLQDELKKKDEIIAKKNRAIQASKKNRQQEKVDEETEDAEEESEDRIVKLEQQISDLKTSLEGRMAETDLEREITSLTGDPKEQEAIRLHYKHSIQRSGNVKKDVQMAFAIANAHALQDLRAKEEEELESEENLAEKQMSSLRGKSVARATEPRKRKAGAFLDKFGIPEAKKYL